jgi:hypothetical protein
MAATFQSLTTVQSGTGSVTVAWPASYAIDDILLIYAESTGGQASSAIGHATTAANSVANTGAGTAGTRNTLFWARAWCSNTIGMPSIVLPDPGDHILAQGMLIRGAFNTDTPYDVSATAVKASASTSCSAPTITTTAADELVIHAISLEVDTLTGAQYGSTGANGNLTGLTKQFDVVTQQGNGGGLAAWTGVKATAGATGTLTATSTPSTINASITSAIKNATGTTPSDPRWRSSATAVQASFTTTLALVVPEGVTSGDLLIAHVAAGTGGGLTMTPSSGWTQLFTPNSTNSTSTIGCWWKIATGSDALTVTYNGSVQSSGVMSRFTGHDATTPIPAYSFSAPTTGSNPITCPSVTSTTANNRIVRIIGTNGTGQLTPAAGATIRGECNVPNTGSQSAICVGNTLQASAGASGTFDISTDAFTEQYSVSLCIQPTQAGGGTNYTDSVQTDVTAVDSPVFVLGLSEPVQTDIVGVSTETELLASAVTVQTDIVMLMSLTEGFVAAELPITTVVGITTETDSLGFTESLQTNITAITYATDGLAYSATISDLIVGITTETDALVMGSLTLQTDVLAITTITDTQSGNMQEFPQTDVVATTQVVDVQSMNEPNLITVIVSLTGIVDSIGLYADLITTVVAITTETDLLSLTDTPTTVINADTLDTSSVAAYVLQALTVINADTTESDTLNGLPPPVTGHLLYQAGPLKVMGKI